MWGTRLGKFIETENKSCQLLEEEENGEFLMGRVSIWDNKIVPEIVMVVTQHCEYIQCHSTVHLKIVKMVNFMVCFTMHTRKTELFLPCELYWHEIKHFREAKKYAIKMYWDFLELIKTLSDSYNKYWSVPINPEM